MFLTINIGIFLRWALSGVGAAYAPLSAFFCPYNKDYGKTDKDGENNDYYYINRFHRFYPPITKLFAFKKTFLYQRTLVCNKSRCKAYIE